MKKIFIILFLLFFCEFIIFEFKQNSFDCTFCQDELSENEIENKISDAISSQLGSLDFSSLDKILESLTEEEKSLFGNESFIDKVKLIITGSNFDSQQSIWEYIASVMFDEVLDYLPTICMVIAIGVAFSLVSASRPQSKNKSIGDIIHFVCFSAIILLLVNSTVGIIKLTSTTILGIKNQVDAIMPILLTVMTAIGGNASVGIYSPAVSMLGSIIITIFSSFLLPVFIFRFVFSIVSNFSNNLKLKKFAEFFSSIFKWCTGCVFTIFSAFIAIQGITAGNIDGISIRTAKYAIKNSIPMVGSYLSDGFNLIVASSVLIKNGIGLCALILLLSTVILPVVNIIVFMLLLKFSAAILEPISDEKISSFLSMLSSSVSLLIVLILSCAFMYVILCGVIMCTANYI